MCSLGELLTLLLILADFLVRFRVWLGVSIALAAADDRDDAACNDRSKHQDQNDPQVNVHELAALHLVAIDLGGSFSLELPLFVSKVGQTHHLLS